MKILDWYILKNFLVTFFFSIFLFTIIAVVVDISEHTDNFVQSGLSAWQIFMQYYIAFIPHIVALLFPLFVFIAVIYFTSKLAGRSEFIAILASGVTYRRLLVPYLIGGVLLGALLWFSNAYVIPRAEGRRLTFEANYVNGHPSNNDFASSFQHSVYFRVDSFTYAGIIGYDTSRKRGGPFFMDKIKNNELVYNLRAGNIFWDTAARKWQLQTVFERTIDSLKEHTVSTNDKFMNFNFKPFDLNNDEKAKDILTSPQLQKYIALQEQRGAEGINDLKIENYRRIATPVSVVLLTLMGAMVAGRKVRGGSGVHLAFGFTTAAIFIIMDRFSTIFSTKGTLPPSVAAWIPNMVFVFVAFFIYRTAPK
ncbi:MAG: LptF/LptG family permease [Bacteroidota bacterium]|nr:LptF/LptG family permease [Bacteroidota bacterium]